MTSSVTTLNYDSAVQDVLDWCEANGVSVEDIDLDGDLSVEVYGNPVLEAYFQLAYQQLMEIMYPEVINSLEAQVGEVDFDTLYENADDDINELIIAMIEDDPDLMVAMTRATSNDAEVSNLEALLSQIYTTDTGEQRNLTDDAWELAESQGMTEDFGWIIEQEEAFKSAEQSIVDRLGEYDEAITELTEAFTSGEIDEATYDVELQEIYYGRETMLGMLQALQQSEQTFFEMLSDLIKSIQDTSLTIARQLGG